MMSNSGQHAKQRVLEKTGKPILQDQYNIITLYTLEFTKIDKKWLTKTGEVHYKRID